MKYKSIFFKKNTQIRMMMHSFSDVCYRGTLNSAKSYLKKHGNLVGKYSSTKIPLLDLSDRLDLQNLFMI